MRDMKESHLKPCPFCGAVGVESILLGHDDGGVLYVFCDKCKAHGPSIITATKDADFEDPTDAEFEKVEEMWNTRP